MKITCFTVNAFNDGYYSGKLPVDIVNKNIFLHNVEKFYRKFDFKVFDYNHPLVIECKEKYKEFFDREDIVKSVKTDIVRLYILSKLPYHLYIDDDTLLLKPFKIKNKEDCFFSSFSNFCCIYNGSNLDVFKEMLEIYPFDDNYLLENITANIYAQDINSQRFDFCLMENYTPYQKFRKYTKPLNIKHCPSGSFKFILDNKNPKEIYLSNKIIKNSCCFVFTKNVNKQESYYMNPNDDTFYLYNKIYTKEYVLNLIKENSNVKGIIESKKYIKVVINDNQQTEKIQKQDNMFYSKYF